MGEIKQTESFHEEIVLCGDLGALQSRIDLFLRIVAIFQRLHMVVSLSHTTLHLELHLYNGVPACEMELFLKSL